MRRLLFSRDPNYKNSKMYSATDLISENVISMRGKRETRLEQKISNIISGIKDPSIKSIRIIKHGGLKAGTLALTPECPYCKENLMRIGAEVKRERKKAEYEKLFYFCDECGWIGDVKKSMV